MKRRMRAMLAVVSLLALGACSLGIEHGLDERAANEVVGALERIGVAAQKSSDEGTTPATFSVRVGQNDAPRALEWLRTQGLPRNKRAGLGEVYGQPSLIPTATEEKARYLGALAGELERTLESIDGVVGARVHVVTEEKDLLSETKPRVPARAAVLLKARPGTQPISPADVQRLVAGSVPGLDAASVTVVTTPAPEPTSGTPALVPVGPLRVSQGSRPMLLAATVVALAILTVLALVLVLTARRLGLVEQTLLQRGKFGDERDSLAVRPATDGGAAMR